MTEPLKILLPVDGSPASLAAVRHALRLPAIEYVLVNVQEPASLYEVMLTHDAERLAQLRRDAGADLLREAEALLDAARADYESEVAGGAPERIIVELAESYGCDAIVMGARGQGGGATDSGLGTVAQAVADGSPVPVTLVRAAAQSNDATDSPKTAGEAAGP